MKSNTQLQMIETPEHEFQPFPPMPDTRDLAEREEKFELASGKFVKIDDIKLSQALEKEINARIKIAEGVAEPVVAPRYEAWKESVAWRDKVLDVLKGLKKSINDKRKIDTQTRDKELRAEADRLASMLKAEQEKEQLEKAAKMEAAGDKEGAARVIEDAISAPAPRVVMDNPGADLRGGAVTVRVLDKRALCAAIAAGTVDEEAVEVNEKYFRGLHRALGRDPKIAGVQVTQEMRAA